MKLQTLYKLLFVITTLVLLSCNDTLDKLGFTIQPGNDRVMVGTDTLILTSKTVKVDSVFSKTKYPILGEYIDPIFGTVRSDYVGEFYYPETMSFKEGANIDSVMLTISYTSILGDSLAPMQLAVYKVKERLPRGNKYTNFDPLPKVDMTTPLGKQIFTGRNNTYRTEVYQSGTALEEIKIYEINTALPKSIGQSFLDEYKKPDHGALQNVDTFNDFFPGVYVTTDFGNSTILNVNLTSLKVFYNYLDKGGSSTQQDTIRTEEWRLNITPEVTQINHISNDNSHLLSDDAEGTYVKSPAGVNTEIHFPISQLSDKLKNSALNQAKMIVYALPEVNEHEMVKLSPPDHLLLINKDSVKTFFENGMLPNNINSFIATFDANSYSYNFGNISTLVNYYNKLHRDDSSKPLDQTFQLIPVDATIVTEGASYYSQGSQRVTAVYNQMKPSAVMLDNRTGKLRLDVIYSSF